MMNLKFLLLVGCCLGSAAMTYAQPKATLEAPGRIQSVIGKEVKDLGEGKVLYGYCSSEVAPTKNDGFGYGTTKNVKMSVAIRFSAGLLHILNGRKIHLLKIGAAAATQNATVFIRNSKGENLWTTTVSLQTGWNDVALDTPLAIFETEELYFGFTYTQKNKVYVAALAGQTYKCNGLFISTDNDALEEYTELANLCLLVELEASSEEFDYAASLSSAYTPLAYKCKGEAGQVDVTLFNEGEKKIVRAVFGRFFNGAALNDTSLIFKRSVQPHSTAVLSFPVAPEESGKYTYTLKEIEERAISESSVTTAFSIYDPREAFSRTVLIEEFTSQTCGNCPAAQTKLHNMIAGNEDRIAMVLHHSGYNPDDFTLEESEDYCYFYNSTGTYAPAMMMDRTYISDYSPKTITPVYHPNSLIKSRLLQEINLPSVVSVNIKTAYEETTKRLTVAVSGRKITDLIGNHVGLTVFLLESKYIATQAGGSNKFEHNNFPRYVFSDLKGDVLTFNDDGTYSKEYTYTIPDTYIAYYTETSTEAHPENMHIVAFVANYDTNNPGNCPVLNANKTSSLNDEVITVTDIRSANVENPFSIYVTDGTIYVDGEYESVTIYNLQGMAVGNSHLTSGIYIVKIKDIDHKEHIGKVLVQ